MVFKFNFCKDLRLKCHIGQTYLKEQLKLNFSIILMIFHQFV